MDMKHMRRVIETLFFFINILIKGNLRIKMKALSQSEYGELRNLYESIYTPKVDLAEELLDEIFDELVDEYIEEGSTGH